MALTRAVRAWRKKGTGSQDIGEIGKAKPHLGSLSLGWGFWNTLAGVWEALGLWEHPSGPILEQGWASKGPEAEHPGVQQPGE